MKKYTFEDWLNDRIDYKELELKMSFAPASSRFVTLRNSNVLITKNDYEKIEKCKVEAYNLAIENIFKVCIEAFHESLDRSPYKTEYLNNEIQRIERIINEKPEIWNSILRGGKDWDCIKRIKGSDYLTTIKDREWINMGGTLLINLGYASNDYIRIQAYYEYLQWLRDFQKQQEIKQNSKYKTFPEYLLHNKREQLAEKIKQTFLTEKGKAIKLLLVVLEEKQLITLGNRQFKAITDSLRIYLNRDIGTYQSLNDPKYFDDIDKNPIRTKIDIILKQLSAE